MTGQLVGAAYFPVTWMGAETLLVTAIRWRCVKDGVAEVAGATMRLCLLFL